MCLRRFTQRCAVEQRRTHIRIKYAQMVQRAGERHIQEFRIFYASGILRRASVGHDYPIEFQAFHRGGARHQHAGVVLALPHVQPPGAGQAAAERIGIRFGLGDHSDAGQMLPPFQLLKHARRDVAHSFHEGRVPMAQHGSMRVDTGDGQFSHTRRASKMISTVLR